MDVVFWTQHAHEHDMKPTIESRCVIASSFEYGTVEIMQKSHTIRSFRVGRVSMLP